MEPVTRPAPAPAAPATHGADAVVRRANIAFAGSVLGGALAIANEVLCARYLGVQTYGLYALALVLARVAEVIAVCGLPVAILRLLSIFRESGEARDVRGTLIASIVPPLVVGSLFGAALWLLAPEIAAKAFAKDAATPFVRAAAIAVPFMALSEVLGAVTRGFGYAGYYVVIRNVVPPLAFMVLLVAIAGTRSPAPWVAAAFCAAYAAAAAAGVACVLRAGRGVIALGEARLPLRKLYAYALPILLNNVLYLIVGGTAIVVVGLVRSDAEVGIFRASMQFLILFDMIQLAFLAALSGTYAVLEHEGQRQALQALVAQSTKWISLLSLALLCVLALGRHDLLHIMGPGFDAGAEALLVLLVGESIMLCTGSLGILLVSAGRPRAETASVAVAAALGVALNLALVPARGILGAALATALPCVAVAALRIVQVRRMTGIRVWSAAPVRKLAVPALAAGAAVCASFWLPAADGGALMPSVGRLLLIAASVAGFFWIAVLGPDDREGIRAAARRLIPRDAGP